MKILETPIQPFIPKNMKKIIFVHLLNDYSGSPRVLSQVIKAFQLKKYDIELYTARSDGGFLSGLTNKHHFYFYKRFDSKYLTLVTFMISQASLLLKLLKYRNDDVIFYVNTMLPFGAGLAGKLMGKPVCYHVHETSLQPAKFKLFLRSIVQRSASRTIFVSRFVEEMESFPGIPQQVIYNALSRDLAEEAKKYNYQWRKKGVFEVLMICSLKSYKGVNEFVSIATLCQNDTTIKFTLILNATQIEIDGYFSDTPLPPSLTLVSRQNDVVPFHKNASLLLNLSRIDQCVETFGLTIIEAIAFGVPVIVPPVGGPTEIIRDGEEGYLVSSYDIKLIARLIADLSMDKSKCMMLSAKARERSKEFSEDIFEAKVINFITKTTSWHTNSLNGQTSMPEKNKLAIIGTNGLPGKYGGWDQLMNHLTVNLRNSFSFVVYTSSHDAQKGLKFFNGAELKIIKLKANGIQSILYDIFSMIHSVYKKYDILLILGTSGCIFLPIIKLFNNKIVLNPDGAEWKRGKWNGPAKWFLRLSEKFGVKYSDVVIADNKIIQDYIYSEYNVRAELIEYGGDNTQYIPMSVSTANKYGIQSGRYAFKVCRIEPENNIDLILEAFAGKKLKLILIGNWNFSQYGKNLRKMYSEYSNLLLLDPIYDQAQLDELRGNCSLYIHGHSVGGTNPSLVEAMNLELCCVVFNIDYNIETTENSAIYFSSVSELSNILKTYDDGLIDIKSYKRKMKSIAKRRYLWEIITEKYATVLKKA